MVGTEIPPVARALSPVAAKEHISTRLAVEQLEHARAACASENRRVVKPTHRCSPRGHARRVGTDPKSLQVPKEQVCAYRQRCTCTRATCDAKPGQQTFHRVFSL